MTHPVKEAVATNQIGHRNFQPKGGGGGTQGGYKYQSMVGEKSGFYINVGGEPTENFNQSDYKGHKQVSEAQTRGAW